MNSYKSIEAAIQADHKDLVKTTFKKLPTERDELTHAILGIAGEVGELVDAIKKHLFYGKQLDISNVAEELGDIEYYLQALRLNLKLSRTNILEMNIKKLEKRYPGRVFTEAAAIARADKVVNAVQAPLGSSFMPGSNEWWDHQRAMSQERDRQRGGGL